MNCGTINREGNYFQFNFKSQMEADFSIRMCHLYKSLLWLPLNVGAFHIAFDRTLLCLNV